MVQLQQQAVLDTAAETETSESTPSGGDVTITSWQR